MSSSRIIYVSYDRFPSRKGAGVHIDAFARALGAAFGPIDLVTVAGAAAAACPTSPAHYCTGVRHWPLPARGANLLQRVFTFRRALSACLAGRHAEVIHVRSIFEGYPVARRKRDYCRKLVYEVNGLPSIELKYHYPGVADDYELLQKLRAQEQTCLDAADLIVTVSPVTAEYLERRGVEGRRIRVIPNGVDPELFPYRRPRRWDGRELHLLYCGTVSAWQGVSVALDALDLCRRDFPARLTIVGEGRRRQIRQLEQSCRRRGLGEYVQILEAVSQARLAELHHASDVVLAPLKSNDRNLTQGCCPLKVLEAMSSGTPLIASDLPAVRDLARSGVDALLVRPGSAKAIKDATLRLRRDPHLGPQLSAAARRRVKLQFTWTRAQQRLVSAYEESLGMTPANTS